MQNRLNGIEKKLAENYPTRNEVANQIKAGITSIEKILRDHIQHMNEKFRWLERAIDKKT